MVVLKQCSNCTKLGTGPKPVSDFGKCAKAKDGLQSNCTICQRTLNKVNYDKNPARYKERGKQWREANPTDSRRLWIRSNLKNNYGISEIQYSAMFEQQKGQCAICSMKLVSQLNHDRPMNGQPDENVARVDHCHKTKKVRGLLCFGCNVGLGKFHDSIGELKLAIRYLEVTQTGTTA